MASYYKKINGKNYDREMLEVADKSVKGKGDGRISLADAKAIIIKAKDGGKITDTEVRTLNYILEKYRLTESALKYMEESLADNLILNDKNDKKDKKDKDNKESKVSPVYEAPAPAQREYQNESKPLAQKKEKKTSKTKYLIILLILALIAFLFIKFFCKKDIVLTEKSDETKLADNNEEKTDSANLEKSANIEKSKTDEISDKNEYVVKTSDTLVIISEAVYGDYKYWDAIYKANKDKIKNPVFIFPGQVLIMPEKK
jgi:nucleoid-associated protein YgaU